MKPEVFMCKLYRKQGVQIGIPDMPIFSEEGLEIIKKQAGERLLAHFYDDKRPSNKKPLFADLVDGDNQVVSRLSVLPDNTAVELSLGAGHKLIP